MTLTYEDDLDKSQAELSCHMPRSKVISFDSYRASTHARTHAHTADRLQYLDHKWVGK